MKYKIEKVEYAKDKFRWEVSRKRNRFSRWEYLNMWGSEAAAEESVRNIITYPITRLTEYYDSKGHKELPEW